MDSILYAWAELNPGSFFLRLGSLWLATFTVLTAPIAEASFNPGKDPLKFVLAAGIGTLLLVSLVVLRIHLVSQVLHQEGENNLCQKKGENKVAYPVVVSSGKAVNCVPCVGMELFW